MFSHDERDTLTAAPIYVGLLTGAKNSSGKSAEVSGGGYARVLLNGDPADWVVNENEGTNSNRVVFPRPTADWGMIVGFGLFDSPSGVGIMRAGPLTSPKSVNAGDAAPRFEPGMIVIQAGEFPAAWTATDVVVVKNWAP